MSTLLQRFCRYVRIDTQADEAASSSPSSPGQLELGCLLVEELHELGLVDAVQDAHGIVLATIPATQTQPVPTMAWIAHLDTSPETSGHGITPIVHDGYVGGDIVLPADAGKVIRVADNPDLESHRGQTLITADGTTLLGSDDKAGVAVIMEAASFLMNHPEVIHGPIRICFTCDEEIGHGVDHLDLAHLGAQVAYTLDGHGTGEIDGETFSADLAVVTIRGVNVHPGIARGRMVNAIRLAALFLDHLPRQALTPETTHERQGFLHPYRIEGGVAQVILRILLRDFAASGLSAAADLLDTAARLLLVEFPQAGVNIQIAPQYRNMAEGLAREPQALEYAQTAMRGPACNRNRPSFAAAPMVPG